MQGSETKNGRFVSIQTRIIITFLTTMAIIFLTNVFMFVNINYLIQEIDNVYISNNDLNHLQSNLKDAHQNLEEYLRTKNTDAIEEYYRIEQVILSHVNQLNGESSPNSILLMEKNIKNLTENYLSVSNDAIEAKQSRNVHKYNSLYEQADTLYTYIDSYIYSLNNQYFNQNTINYNSIVTFIKSIEVANLGLFVAICVINILLLFFLVRNITKPLKNLTATAEQVAKGNFDLEPLPINYNNEVEILTIAFNQMISNLNDNIEKQKKSIQLESAMKEKELKLESHLKDAQIKYLQAQIDPHFLFNTLNAGVQLAMMEQADRTYRYIQTVAEFLRYNVRKHSDIASLREEVQLIDYYMYIINVRYANEINYIKEIDPSLLDINLPRMTLQPIVENCIKHGLSTIEWQKEVKLKIWLADDDICVSIFDNGVGMRPESIHKLLHPSDGENETLEAEAGGIGIHNVISRLQLFFNKDHVMDITSGGAGLGTEIAIFIPH